MKAVVPSLDSHYFT